MGTSVAALFDTGNLLHPQVRCPGPSGTTPSRPRVELVGEVTHGHVAVRNHVVRTPCPWGAAMTLIAPSSLSTNTFSTTSLPVPVSISSPPRRMPAPSPALTVLPLTTLPLPRTSIPPKSSSPGPTQTLASTRLAVDASFTFTHSPPPGGAVVADDVAARAVRRVGGIAGVVGLVGGRYRCRSPHHSCRLRRLDVLGSAVGDGGAGDLVVDGQVAQANAFIEGVGDRHVEPAKAGDAGSGVDALGVHQLAAVAARLVASETTGDGETLEHLVVVVDLDDAKGTGTLHHSSR